MDTRGIDLNGRGAPRASGLPPGSVSLTVAGEPVVLLGERAVYLQRTATLLVADVHLLKAEAAQAAGIPLPSFLGHGDIARLESIVTVTGATRLIVLGDLVHRAALLSEPAAKPLVEAFAAWRARQGVELVLAAGNHDRGLPRHLPAAWRVEVRHRPWQEGRWLFAHDPDTNAGDAYLWAGHVHPAAILAGGGDSLRLPCFVIGPRRALLPAFGKATGGHVVRAGRGERLYPIAGASVIV